MPQITAFGWATWTLVALAQLGLTLAMLRSGAWRLWPSVFTYAAIRSLGTFALMLMAHPTTDAGAARYFYTYWAESAILGVVQVWIIRDIGLSVAALHKGIRTFLSRFVPAIALVYVLASVLVLGLSSWTYLPRFVADANEAAAVAWFATYLTLMFSCQALGIVCNALERGISMGFCGLLLVNFATGLMLGQGVSAAAVSQIQEVAQACALAGWIWIFSKEPLREDLPSIESLRALLSHYSTIIGKLRPTK